MTNIRQGEKSSFRATVSPGKTVLTMVLNWGNTQSKLSLTPYGPDGTKIGTYYDDDDPDGINGKVSIKISSPEGLEPGVWMFVVKGVSVIGNEDYTFDAFAHN